MLLLLLHLKLQKSQPCAWYVLSWGAKGMESVGGRREQNMCFDCQQPVAPESIQPVQRLQQGAPEMCDSRSLLPVTDGHTDSEKGVAFHHLTSSQEEECSRTRSAEQHSWCRHPSAHGFSGTLPKFRAESPCLLRIHGWVHGRCHLSSEGCFFLPFLF